MIDQILDTIAESGDPSQLSGIDAALEDAQMRQDLVATAVERFELAGQIPEDAVAEMAQSVEGIQQFLGGLAMFLGMEEMMEAGLAPSEGPLGSVEDPRPLPLEQVPAQELEQSLVVFARCFYVGFGFGDSVAVEADGFVLPNSELARVEVEWSSARRGDTPVALASEQSEPFGGGRLDSKGQARFDVQLAESVEGGVSHVQGRARIAVPVQVALLERSAQQIEQPAIRDGISATLLACDNDCVRVRVEGMPEEGICRIVARDAGGMRLEERESQTSTREGYEANVRFAGTVADVIVCVALETAQREIEVTATAEPASGMDEPPTVEAPRYRAPGRRPVFHSVDPDDFIDGIETVPGRDGSVMEFNQPAVHLHLPRVDNSAFAEVSFEDVSAYDSAGDPIEFSPAQRGYDPENHDYSISFEGEEMGNPIELARATARVPILYPLEVETVTLTPDEPEAGGLRAEFDGAVVHLSFTEEPEEDSPVDLSWISWRAGREVSAVEALDDTGRALRLLSWTSSSGGRVQLPFWGEPTALRVSIPTRWEKVEWQFDVGPAPLLPEEQRGMSQGCRRGA